MSSLTNHHPTPRPPPTQHSHSHLLQVTAGNAHSIALSESGKIFTWGRNDAGQLGHSDSQIDIYSMEEFPRELLSEELAKQTPLKILAG
jgi:E3 ubiquitin-protein ligase HERC4